MRYELTSNKLCCKSEKVEPLTKHEIASVCGSGLCCFCNVGNSNFYLLGFPWFLWTRAYTTVDFRREDSFNSEVAKSSCKVFCCRDSESAKNHGAITYEISGEEIQNNC